MIMEMLRSHLCINNTESLSAFGPSKAESVAHVIYAVAYYITL